MNQTKLNPRLTKLWENEFVVISEFNDKKIGAALAKSDYIPISSFKSAFQQAGIFAKEKSWNSFLFDKSKLSVFHQPSMEWYYTEWKMGLLEIGLSNHYKILPEIDWFKVSVEAGIVEIKKKHPHIDFDKFNVKYINAISDVD